MHITLCDYVLDIGQNSFEASATEIQIELKEGKEWTEFSVRDNGCGMDEETLRKATDPFFTAPGKHAKRKAGFGLPFLIQAADGCEGSVTLKSQVGVGTEVRCRFSASHIDTPPIGDVATTVVALMAMDGEYNLIFDHERMKKSYRLSREDLLEALGDLTYADSLSLAKAFITSEEEDLQ